MDQLVEKLSSGTHHLKAERAKSAQDLKRSIDDGYVLLKFTETQGGTELGVRLNKDRCKLSDADFGAGTGTIELCGTLVLNYNEVELVADLDVSTLEGRGSLKLIADEPTWRAKQAQKHAASSTSH
jgi:hypothetical protein